MPSLVPSFRWTCVDVTLAGNEARSTQKPSLPQWTSLPICRLERLFGVQRDRAAPGPPRTDVAVGRARGRGAGRSFVVIARVADRRLGLVVDELVGQQDIVIKPLGKSLKSVRGFAGATELGDQRVALILDVASLIEEVLSPGETRFLAAAEAESGRRPVAAMRRA